MSEKKYIFLQPKDTIVDVEYSDGTVVRTNHKFWYDGEVAHLKFFVDDNKQITELKHQIAEKDKEIEELKAMVDNWQKETEKANSRFDIYRSQIIQKGFEDKELNKLIRHQVCEEIREWCEQNEFEVENADQSSDCVVYTYKKLFKKLDQIEKGE